MAMEPEKIARRLGLEPHPEGGFYRETYRAEESLPPGALPDRYGAERSLCTAIYYLLTPESFSALHRLRSDEVLHFYLGDPVEVLLLRPGGGAETVLLGIDLAASQQPQRVVRRGTWFGMRLAARGRCALLGSTVAPGFEFEDFELGDPDELADQYPEHAEKIMALSPR